MQESRRPERTTPGAPPVFLPGRQPAGPRRAERSDTRGVSAALALRAARDRPAWLAGPAALHLRLLRQASSRLGDALFARADRAAAARRLAGPARERAEARKDTQRVGLNISAKPGHNPKI